jgi:hypothetical protein
MTRQRPNAQDSTRFRSFGSLGVFGPSCCFASVLQFRMPLAFDDAALARIAIGATPIAPHARSLAARTRTSARSAATSAHPAGAMAAAAGNGGAIYWLTGRLTEVGALD